MDYYTGFGGIYKPVDHGGFHILFFLFKQKDGPLLQTAIDFM